MNQCPLCLASLEDCNCHEAIKDGKDPKVEKFKDTKKLRNVFYNLKVDESGFPLDVLYNEPIRSYFIYKDENSNGRAEYKLDYYMGNRVDGKSSRTGMKMKEEMWQEAYEYLDGEPVVKTKTIILHHVQPLWISGKPFEYEYMNNILEVLDSGNYDKIIITYFSEDNVAKINDFLMDHFGSKYYSFEIEYIEYDYGWDTENLEMSEEQENFKDEYEDEYGNIYTHNHIYYYSDTRYTLLEEWMNIKDEDVFIGGLFDGECLSDLETGLEYYGVKYKRIEQIIK